MPPVYNPTGPRAGYITPTRPYAKRKKPFVVTDFWGQNEPRGGKAAATPTPTPTPTATGKLTNPWDAYTRMLDQREQDMMERLIRARTQAGIDLFGSMQGFGTAATNAASEAWARATQGYDRAAGADAAYQGAAADDYTLGLQQANERIAQDFAAVGQGGPANIRDTAAAAQQVGTVGGANPAALMGLVGKNWESYAKTVPGSMTFMQEQNLNQARREAMSDTDRIISEWQEEMLNNPEQAIEQWQAATKYGWDVADRATAKATAKTKAAQEARAFNLQVQAFNLKYGAEMADQAKALGESTGFVHIWNPKTGQFDNTGQKTEARRKADMSNVTTRRGQTLTAAQREADRVARVQIANATNQLRARGLDLDEKKIQKDEGTVRTMSPERRAIVGKRAGEAVYNAYYGPLKKDGTRGDPVPPEQVIRILRAEGIPLSIVLDAIAQFAWMPNSRWARAQPWRRKNAGAARPPLSQGAANAPR